MIKPSGHRILILPEQVEARTNGGIILAATTKERDQQATMRGTVMEIGINAWKAFDAGTPWAEVGDKVVFRKYAGEVVKDGDVEYRVINDEDCICVIREEV